MEWLGLGLVGLSAALLILLSRTRRASPGSIRVMPGLGRLYRAFGLSVEDGRRFLIALGGQSLLTRNAGSALAGLGLLREVARKASASDRPPVAVAGESALAMLAQDTLHAGYRDAGAPDYYQPVTGRLAGLTPFSSAAATMAMFDDEHVAAAALIGHFGTEAGLLSEAADRSNILLVGATGDPAGQSVLFATASEALIGEELFAAPAYFAGGPTRAASLVVQDILRWVIIAALVLGTALKLLGII